MAGSRLLKPAINDLAEAVGLSIVTGDEVLNARQGMLQLDVDIVTSAIVWIDFVDLPPANWTV